MPIQKTAFEVIESAEDMLLSSRLGLNMLDDRDPVIQAAGARNSITFGRSVTFVLQNLRSVTDSFDGWYESQLASAEHKELFKLLNDLRNKILKEGDMPTSSSVTLNGILNINEIANKYPPPPGATGFFIGDRKGRNGWTVEMPDGTKQSFYIGGDIPGMNVDAKIHIQGRM